MNRAWIYRQMAAKWLEIAARTPNLQLKQCYMDRAMEYRTLAVSSKTGQRSNGKNRSKCNERE
jgi:hypothetical protein